MPEQRISGHSLVWLNLFLCALVLFKFILFIKNALSDTAACGTERAVLL